MCQDCREEVIELEPPGETVGSYGYKYALLGGRTPTSRQEICSALQAVNPGHRGRKEVHYRINHDYLCEVCSNKPRAGKGKAVSEDEPRWAHDKELIGSGEWVRAGHLILEWTDVQPKGRPWLCPCPTPKPGCEDLSHVIQVGSLPIHSELAGFVYRDGDLPVKLSVSLPLGEPHWVNDGWAQSCVLPFYVQDAWDSVILA